MNLRWPRGSQTLTRVIFTALLSFSVFVTAGCNGAARMSFFVTSVPTGDGGNLGGLEGADAHCQRLAIAAGSPKRQWRAYLSVGERDGHPPVNARDRIGTGPWFNTNGFEIAKTVADLHGAGNRLGGRDSLDEHGNFILANEHDILTGSNPDGTLADGDTTCGDWTSTDGHAMVGHSNKVGSIGGDRARSWNSAHLSAGCTTPLLQQLGGRGLLYCFAAD
jgi:hypothetical protein